MLAAARRLAAAGDGLVTVLLGGDAIVSAEHWSVERIDAAAVVAAARDAESAVLIVVGHPAVAARATVAAGALHQQLTAAGIEVGAAIYVPVLAHGVLYPDVSAASAACGDGLVSWAREQLRRRHRRGASSTGIADTDRGQRPSVSPVPKDR
ncbi:hypothetical protein [Nocardia sp. NPDC004260]